MRSASRGPHEPRSPLRRAIGSSCEAATSPMTLWAARASPIMSFSCDRTGADRRAAVFSRSEPRGARRAWSYAIGPGGAYDHGADRRRSRRDRGRRAWLRHSHPGSGRSLSKGDRGCSGSRPRLRVAGGRGPRCRPRTSNRAKPLPGYGHPLHKPVDPRAERIIALARERGIAGRSVEAALALTKAAAQTWGKPLPMNVSMSIAATLRDVDVPSGLIRAVPILARTAGLIAHCIEEEETPIGFLMASKGRRRSFTSQTRTEPPHDGRAGDRAGAVGG